MRKLWMVICCGFLLGIAAAQQQDFSKVEIKVTKVAGTVYMLQGAGGNIGVSVGEDGILIVDDQYAPLADKIKAALKGITDKPVKFVLNTHWHGDHTGGNEIFGQGAPVIAHSNVRKRMVAGGKYAFGDVPPAPKGALPVITFDDRLVVHINGEDIRAIHFPNGHTDGDIVVYFTQSNVVHMGDDFFTGRFPFIDLLSGGSVKGLIGGVEKVLADLPPNVKVIAGHGALGTPDDLRTYLAMLKETAGAVEAALKQGKTLDQLKQERVLGKWDKWGSGFISTDRFIEILYNDLSGKKVGQFVTHN
jgi:glyoxylase-like metal-dependent hydrolase (beta-lactamase superfamily II)